MSEPVTFGHLAAFVFYGPGLWLIGSLAVMGVAVALMPRECRECGRRLHRESGRRFCPFHDDGSPYP